MECIRGKHRYDLDTKALRALTEGRSKVLLDMGTGDGRYVARLACSDPAMLGIGLDTCRENLRNISGRGTANVIFAIANAEQLPHELHGIADEITINFPWGSLLSGLVEGGSPVWSGIRSVRKNEAALIISVNAEALQRVGLSLKEGGMRVLQAIELNGFVIAHKQALTPSDLRRVASTWGKRLAFGRDPRALRVAACAAPATTGTER